MDKYRINAKLILCGLPKNSAFYEKFQGAGKNPAPC